LILITISFIVGNADEQNYHSDSITHFKTIMSGVNATELSDDDAKDLIRRVTDVEKEVQDDSDNEAMEFGEETYDPSGRNIKTINPYDADLFF
jgi:hypothetical protein